MFSAAYDFPFGKNLATGRARRTHSDYGKRVRIDLPAHPGSSEIERDFRLPVMASTGL
jgi:hypothetical protein